MKKSKKLLTFLLATVLVMAMLITVVACNPPVDEDPTDDTATDGTVSSESLLISNGKFQSTTGATYVKTAASWTLTAGSWSKSSTGLTTGVADISTEKFTANKGAINESIATPTIAPNTPKKDDGSYQDTNALVISMDGDEANGSIFYVSSQAKAEKGKYYKVSVDVWTNLLFDESDLNKDTRGANIILSNGTSAGSVEVAKFTSINTSEAWQTYTFYIEASKFEDRNFYVQLWLGYGPSQIRDLVVKGNNTSFASYYTAKGTAMFDNVLMEKISEEDYNAALVNQYNDVTGASETVANQNMQSVYGVARDTQANGSVNGGAVVLSYTYVNNNFTSATGYSTSSTTDTYFTSAKVGTTPNYTIVKGKEDVKDDSEFPSYSSAKDPVGIFDLTKLYYVEKKDGATVNEYADAYSKVNSKFVAPDSTKLGVTYDATNNVYNFSRSDNPTETKALMVYHQGDAISGAGFQSANDILIEKNKYYAVSVWVFIWVPEYDEEEFCGTLEAAPVEPTDTEATDYQTKHDQWEKDYAEWETKRDTYNDKHDTWVKLNSYAEGTSPVKATLRLQGASTDEKAEALSDGTWGTWQQITVKVKGNQLADRKVNLELWYGEGEWESDTLYPGGCIFDNVTIKEYATAEELNAQYASGEIKNWDTIEEDDYADFGLSGTSAVYSPLATEATDGENSWYYNLVDTKTYVDMSKTDSNLYAGILNGSAVADWDNSIGNLPAFQNIAKLDANEDVFNLVSAGGTTTFNYLVLNHAQYTASKVFFKPSETSNVLKTAPNHFYRLSMWVNTQNLKSGSNFKVSLYDTETDAVINSSATQSSLAVTEWTEISFVLQSSATESDSMYLLVEFGSGDIYTPASHASGAILITAMTWTEIQYSEFSAASGTYVKSFDLSSSTSTGSSITNSDFSQIASDSYKDDKDDVFSTEGKLTGIADPKNWTKATEAYLLSAPTFITKTTDELTWKHTVKEVTHYFIYNADKKLVNVIDATDANSYTQEDAEDVLTRTYKYVPQTKDNYYVRAISNIDSKIYASALSSAHDCTTLATVGTAETVIEDNATEIALNSVKAGIVNADSYNDVGLGADFYAPQASTDLTYTSALSSNLLMISSDYDTYLGYTNSSSASLSTESFYRLSVWVKTVGDAKASVTLKNSSNYLTATDHGDAGEYVGYTGINTADKWVRYDFYIATNLSSGSLTLEMYLGNKYAKNTVALSENGTKVSSGTSKGTVYFDDVMLVKLSDEAAFNKLVYGVENIDEIETAELKELLTKYGYNVNQENADISVQNLLAVRKAYVNANAVTLASELDATATYFANEYKYELVNYNKDSFDNYDKKTDSDANKYLGNESNSFTHYNSNSVFNNETVGSTTVKDDEHPNHSYGVFNKKDISSDLIAHLTSKDYLSADSTYALAEAFTEAQITEFLTNTYAVGHDNYEGNNNYLMMANITKPSTQSYQSSSLSMAATSYYKITFYAKYLGTDANKKPEFRFIYNNSDKLWKTIEIAHSNEMVEYTFYYANESSSSVSAYLAYFLGSKDAQGEEEVTENFMNGILIVDDLSIVKLDGKEAYEAALEATKNDSASAGKYNSYLTEATDSTTDEKPVEDPEEESDEDGEKQINPQVWLIISSVVIGLILVAVIVVMIYRKLKTKVTKKLRKVKVDSQMPADFEKKQASDKIRKKAEGRKKDISLDDYND